MGVPAQKYGLESLTAYLGMLLWMAERDKADDMKKIADFEKDISTHELWIKNAKKIRDSLETSYWNIEVSKPQVAVTKTVLRMKGLPTSGKQSELIALLRKEEVKMSKEEWDSKLEEWEEEVSSLQSRVAQLSQGVVEEDNESSSQGGADGESMSEIE
jgi:hypothetical protein